MYTSQSAPSYYRAILKCTNTGLSDTSASFFINSSPLASGTLSINNMLPAGGTNFRNFTDAINYIKCGISGPVLINVAAGSGAYNETFEIPPIPGASTTNTVTINGNGATLRYTTNDPENRSAIILNGADNIIIDSLTVDVAQGTYGWGILLTDRADNNIIRKCTINTSTNGTYQTFAGILINGSKNGLYHNNGTNGSTGNGNLITGNKINGGDYGVYIYGGSLGDYTIVNNTVSNNIIQDTYSAGVYIYGCSSTLISKNDISLVARSSYPSGIYCEESEGITIEKNRLHNLSSGIIAAPQTLTTTPAVSRIENNVIYNLKGNTGINVPGAKYWNIYHNTILFDDQQPPNAADVYGIRANGTNLNVKNNIVYISRSGTGTKYCLYYGTGGVTSSNQNVLINNSTGGSNYTGYYNAPFTTLAAWKAANNGAYDQQSIDTDPVFANVAAGDLSPTNFQLNNKGLNVGVTTDILGIARGATPDPGAYEISTLTAGINMAADAVVSPLITSKGCYTSAEQVIVRIRNNSTSTINFTSNPVTVTVNVTGAINQTVTNILNTGTLASDATMNLAMPASIDMSTVGIYNIKASITLSGDVNTLNDTTEEVTRTKIALAAGVAGATPQALCSNAIVTRILSASGSDGYAGLQWVQSINAGYGFFSLPGANSSPFNLVSAVAETRYYRLVASCGGITDTTAPVIIAYNNPQVLSTTPGSRCGPGTVTLTATATAGAELNWYNTSTGGSVLSKGTSFTTPSISGLTNYYVSASSIVNANLGRSSRTDLTFGSTTNTGLVFSAISEGVLKSVNIYPTGSGAGTITIVLKAGNSGPSYTYATATVNIPAIAVTNSVKTTIPLNFSVAPGNYYLSIEQFTGGLTGLGREFSNGGPFPYTKVGTDWQIISSFTSINTPVTTSYNYFYDWQIEQPSCFTARTLVLARTDDCSTYTFTGTGNWNNPANWSNGIMPPSVIPSGKEVFIDPSSGSAVLNVPVTVSAGGKITVMPGKNFIIQGNLTLQ